MTAPVYEYVDFLEDSLVIAQRKMFAYWQDGWEEDETRPLSAFGWQYAFGLRRVFDHDRPAPKLTRAEILAKARAARGKSKEVAE